MNRVCTRAELLKLHVEAVWGVRLPPLTVGDIELCVGGEMPHWALYVAALGNDQVRLWRPDISRVVREELLNRAVTALMAPLNAAADVEWEVALHWAAPPVLAMTQAAQ